MRGPGLAAPVGPRGLKARGSTAASVFARKTDEAPGPVAEAARGVDMSTQNKANRFREVADSRRAAVLVRGDAASALGLLRPMRGGPLADRVALLEGKTSMASAQLECASRAKAVQQCLHFLSPFRLPIADCPSHEHWIRAIRKKRYRGERCGL